MAHDYAIAMSAKRLREDIERIARLYERPPWKIARAFADLVEKDLMEMIDPGWAHSADALRALADSYNPTAEECRSWAPRPAPTSASRSASA
jgi:hypothetical protein